MAIRGGTGSACHGNLAFLSLVVGYEIVGQGSEKHRCEGRTPSEQEMVFGNMQFLNFTVWIFNALQRPICI